MDYQGHSVYCTFCHGDPLTVDPNDPYLIRYCETCHSPETLHAISGHVDGGYWYDENGDWTEITTNQRCNTCHNGTDVIPMLYAQQAVGTYDTMFSELTEYDCRVCHGTSTADRHHALTECIDPPAPPMINKNACDGMSPIVGEKYARVTLTGTNFGNNGQLSLCGDYKVQMKEGTTWIDLPVISWTDNLIEYSIPPWTFSNYTNHKIRVKTPSGISNRRNFYVLPAPVVDRIEDDTGGDTQGPAGGWLTIYSTLNGSKGTFVGNRRSKWYTDTLGGSCPKFFGSIYVVTLTSSSGHRYAAKMYTDWNASGNNDSFKIKLENLWRDDDGDYYKDGKEPISDLPLVKYSVQVCLIIYADTNDNGKFSGDKDTIYQVVKTKSDIIYELTAP
jgi:hypothetical protein